MSLLSGRDRRQYRLAVAVQMAVSLMDLLGVLLLGVVGVLASVALSGEPPPASVNDLLGRFGFDGAPLMTVAVVVAGIAALLLILKSVIYGYLVRRVFRFLGRCQAHVSTDLVRRLTFAPLSVSEERSSQEVAYAIFSGTQAAILGVLGSLSIVVAELTLVGLMGALLLVVDPLATAVAVTILAGTALASQRFLARWSQRLGRDLAVVHIETVDTVQEEIAAFREIRVLGRERSYVARVRETVTMAAGALADSNFIIQVPKLVYEAALVVGATAVTVVMLLSKDLEAAVASLALFLVAGSRVIPSLLRASNQGVALASSAGQATAAYALDRRLQRLDSAYTEVASTASLSKRAEFDPSVVVDDVTFTYQEDLPPALSNVSLVIPAGTHVALVGPSGSGKSTLADVILGLRQPTSGEVLVGGVEAPTALRRWPGGIAYVPQSTVIANKSVRENVALGLPREAIDDESVWRSLGEARLRPVVEQTPGGLNAMVGERGMKLSGGQRQRLGLARALYSAPQLLVLDEATSALDAETEADIAAAISELTGTVTVVTIAHRLATVVDADVVVYLREGQVIASGSFELVRSAVPDFDRQARLLGMGSQPASDTVP
jgi:ABC-type multidrug transport system fused ATPase/permease subunit